MMSQSTTSLERPISPSPSPSTLHDTAVALTVLNRVFARYGRRDFALRLWDGTYVPSDPGVDCRFTFALNRPGVLRRMLLPPNELALGEAYLDGDWDIEGDIVAAMRLGDLFEELSMGMKGLLGLARMVRTLPEDRPRDGEWEDGVRGKHRAILQGRAHSKERDQRAVTYHYDVGNDFYGLWLGQGMIYSCGYFKTGEEDLDTAQMAKLEHICRKLRLKAGDRLLDIGCGWGGLISYAAEKYGVDATGITLSQPQADLANKRIAEAGLGSRCRAVLLDYRDLDSQKPFDKISSIGMAEHVGKAKLPEYFESAWRALKPGGLFLNHAITAAANDPATRSLLDRFVFKRGAFVRKYVFPDGELIPLGDALGMAERIGFEVRDVESWREHYAITLRHWIRNLDARREEAARQLGERTCRVWRLYMAGCCHAFSNGRLSVHQSLLSKPDGEGRSHLPMTREDIYA